ncbi:MAG: SMI1/KNR4 family protein [Chloroflexota bacterium]
MDDYKRVFEKLRELATPYHLRARLHRPDEVDLAERELDVRFPKDYRFYLLNHSDITLPHYELAHVYADQRESRLSLFSLLSDMQKYHRVNDNLLPFVSDNGDYHCFEMLGRHASKDRFFAHDYYSKKTWHTFAEWVEDVWIAGWVQFQKDIA